MSFSSDQTGKLREETIRASSKPASFYNPCANCPTPISKLASYNSIIRECKGPTPAEFALYPKVAVASSVRTQQILNMYENKTCEPSQRFSKYQRYRPPVPCALLPQKANTAGISLPSFRECNIYPT